MNQSIILKTKNDLLKCVGTLSPSDADVIRFVYSYVSIHPGVLEESCIEASRAIVLYLRACGVKCLNLEGDLLLEAHSWLQHRVALVEGSNHWFVIDLAARQVPRFSEYELLVILTPPSKGALGDR